MQIRPFQGWRYPKGSVTGKIAPPYDILDQAGKDALLAESDVNIVAVDLPHMPPKELGPEEEYLQAAALLKQWQADGVLVQDAAPAIYAYEQSYTWAGKTYARRAMLTSIRATPFGEDVIPHEHTFAGPKADRLKLTECTLTQMSPIFGFYADPIGVTDLLWAAAGEQPDLEGELNGVTEKLWVVTDRDVIAKIQTGLAETPAYIADGHHRYTTAMNYAAGLRESGAIDADHETNFVLFALVAGDDAGLLVLPTHRVVSGLTDGFTLESLAETLAEDFDIQEMDAGIDLSDADTALADLPEHTLAAFADGKLISLTLKSPESMLAAAPEECDAWRDLDVAILHKLIIDKALEGFKAGELSVAYTPDGNEARRMVTDGEAQVALLLRGTPLQAVRDVADASAAMPHKSTYFYPKLATGMVLKPLR